MSTPVLQLTDADNNVYSFPPDFWLGDDSWRKSINVENRAFANGGVDTGDGFLEARIITIEGYIRADNLEDFNNAIAECNKAILRGGKLTVSDDTTSRYIVVSGAANQTAYIGAYRLERPYSISFVALFPYWEETTEAIVSQTVADGDEIFVDNSGSVDMVLPIISFDADQGSDVGSVRLTNVSDGGMAFEYINADFKQNAILIADSKEGTVKLNSNDSISFVTGRRFLRLQPTNNKLVYEGGDCTISIAFRKVSL